MLPLETGISTLTMECYWEAFRDDGMVIYVIIQICSTFDLTEVVTGAGTWDLLANCGYLKRKPSTWSLEKECLSLGYGA